MCILPSLGLFGLSTANGAAAAGYYGIEPTDVQYSMVIFYAAVASFFALERRFFDFIAAKQYLIIATILQIITSYFCYVTRNFQVLLLFRFLQGMANCATTTICITLIFGRLHNERSREIGYSVFYGLLLCISAFTTLFTAPIIDAFNYNILYKVIIFMYLPGTLLLFVTMNNVRLSRKFPLYQVDWASFIIYAVALSLLGYVLIYGQQYYWLQDNRTRLSLISAVGLLAVHVIRQKKLKRPYLSLAVFRYRNFKVGALLIFVLYICRGAINITIGYFASVLGMDPIHIGLILLVNVLGIILSAAISSRLIIQRKPMRFIWMGGFLLLLIFHGWMYFLFTSQANASSFVIPLFIQGIAVGTLMTPIIVFMVSSVPVSLGSSASATGVFFRFVGFCSSIALINYFSLYKQSEHYNRFQQSITNTNPGVVQKIAAYQQLLTSRGMAPDQAAKLANGLLARTVTIQSQLRYAMDYYQLLCWLILGVILLIALYPYLNRTVVNLKATQPAPASY